MKEFYLWKSTYEQLSFIIGRHGIGIRKDTHFLSKYISGFII